MDQKTMYIVVAVVAVVAIAAAAFVLMNNGGGDTPVPEQDGDENIAAFNAVWPTERYSDGDYTWPARLLVLGNADLDDDLDEDDIEAIEDMIKNGYDYVELGFMADANYDGVVNEDDITYLKELMKDDYDGIAYYFDCDFKIAEYDMSAEVKTSNILTQTLDMLLILAPESVVAVDDRCANSEVVGASPQGGFWNMYASVLDYSSLGSVGSHKAPNAERYLEVARTYGDGYLTAVMNATDTYDTGDFEQQVKDAREPGAYVQVIRCPSWERGGVDNGMLLLGFLFHKKDVAADWVEWHDSYYNDIMDKVEKYTSTLSDDEKLKVAVGVLGDTDVAVSEKMELNYTTSAEWQGLKRMGINDVGGAYLEKVGGGSNFGQWSVPISKESFLTMVTQAGGLEYYIGTYPGPFNVYPYNSNNPDLQTYLDHTQSFFDAYDIDAELMVIGWAVSSGPMELMYYVLLANEFYDWGYDIEKITNEGLQWMGVYGDGDYQWTYETLSKTALYPYEI